MTTELRKIVFTMEKEATLKQMSEDLCRILLHGTEKQMDDVGRDPIITTKDVNAMTGEVITNVQIEEQEMIATEEGHLEQVANDLRKFVKQMK